VTRKRFWWTCFPTHYGDLQQKKVLKKSLIKSPSTHYGTGPCSDTTAKKEEKTPVVENSVVE
jgi:hypothetical protein